MREFRRESNFKRLSIENLIQMLLMENPNRKSLDLKHLKKVFYKFGSIFVCRGKIRLGYLKEPKN